MGRAAIVELRAAARGKCGRDPAGWRDAFRSSTATLAIPYAVSLEGFPPLDRNLGIASAPLTAPEGSTLWAQSGNSYSQWVNLAEVDASLALLPPGFSEHPGSAYYLAEKAEWESGTLRAAPLDRAAVEAISASVVTLEYQP